MPDSNAPPDEQRRRRRHFLSEPVQIYDRASQRLLGRLVNIHAEGLMVVGQHVFAAEHLYQFDLHLPQAVNGRRIIPLGVDCLWSRNEGEGVHWAGCKIIDLGEQALLDLHSLIDLLGQPEGEEFSG